MIFDVETTYRVWMSLEKQLFPITMEKKNESENYVDDSKKWSRPLKEY